MAPHGDTPTAATSTLHDRVTSPNTCPKQQTLKDSVPCFRAPHSHPQHSPQSLPRPPSPGLTGLSLYYTQSPALRQAP